MWKFKTSKFKNAAAKISNKEDWVTGVSASNLNSSCGNHIKASATYIVYNTENAGGSSLGVVPLDGRKGKLSTASTPTIQAHSDYVTDFDFSPFDDYLLATGSQDCTVKLWHLPESLEGLSSICNPLCQLTTEERNIDCTTWNPVVDNVLAVAVNQTIKIFDVTHQQLINAVSCDQAETLQSISWKPNGSILASTAKDKQLRVVDPRLGTVAQSVSAFGGNRDSRVLWLADEGKDFLLTTGFNSMRQRELVVRDARDLSKSLKTLSFDSSTGTLIPLYDADTSMLFIAGKVSVRGKGDVSIRYLEVSDKEPFFTENSMQAVEQTKGAAIVPKRAMDVMSCEVNRLVLLTRQAVMAVSYIVPRKSCRDFQEDLFPDTFSGSPLLSADGWIAGNEADLQAAGKHTLNPSKGTLRPLRRTFGSPAASDILVPSKPNMLSPMSSVLSSDVPPPLIAPSAVERSPAIAVQLDTNRGIKPTAGLATVKSPAPTGESLVDQPPSREKKPPMKTLAGVRQCKFRHLQGVPLHRSLYIENLRNLSQSVPGESNGFQVNRKFCAVPLGGSGGLVGIILTDKPGRLPDTGVFALQNGSAVTDFAWDPFNDFRIAVACDDAKLKIWDIPPGGLTETLTEPTFYLHGHTEKLYFVQFHPLASDVVATGSYDMSVRIWNLSAAAVDEEQCIILQEHTDTIFCFAWSMDGRLCATLCKDGKLRVYDPRKSTTPISTGTGFEGSRGCRLAFVCYDRLIAATGFDRASVRQVAVYDATNPKAPLHRIDLDTAPAVLVPHYDEDSSTLFVTGKGDGVVKTFEISPDEFPHLFALSDFKGDGLHQALSFLPKLVIDVRKVEFARAYRLTVNSIEPVSFRVPRIKTEYFQDDLFPDTRVKWEPALSASNWFNGSGATSKLMSLKPADMKLLSEVPVETNKQQKYENFHEYSKHKTDEQKKDELINAMTNKMNLNDGPLPQDLTEGCDPEEWDD